MAYVSCLRLLHPSIPIPRHLPTCLCWGPSGLEYGVFGGISKRSWEVLASRHLLPMVDDNNSNNNNNNNNNRNDGNNDSNNYDNKPKTSAGRCCVGEPSLAVLLCNVAFSKSVEVLFNGLEAVLVLPTLIIPK